MLLLIIILAVPIGLIHAGSSYVPVLFDDDSTSMSDTVSVVVCVSGHCVSVSDSTQQSDVLFRQATLSKNQEEQLASNEQITKDVGHVMIEWLIVSDTGQRNVGKPLTETLNLVESLSEVFVSNDNLWLTAVLMICIGAGVAGIAGVVAAVSRRKPPKPFKNIPRASAP